MKIKTGTNHFLSFVHAVSYYRPLGFDSSDVHKKLENGEIKLGKPEEKPGRTISLNEKEGRFFIQE